MTGTGQIEHTRPGRARNPTRGARRVATARVSVGLFCLMRPYAVLGATGEPRERETTLAARITRILGARHLAQSAVELSRPTRPVLLLDAVVDAIHALSCLGPIAPGGTRWRRSGALNAAGALGFCAATAATVPRRPPDRTDREHGAGAHP